MIETTTSKKQNKTQKRNFAECKSFAKRVAMAEQQQAWASGNHNLVS
jgi:hypothetical protein